jgi:ABC-type phosphate/phosphonate transport system substrate-binding protein
LDLIAREGLVAGRDFELEAFDRLLGKHGDHTGGERDAARALMEGRADAACMIEANYLGFTREGLLTRDSTRIVAQTEPYDHCNFTVLDGAPAKLIARFRELLLGMEYTDPEVRPLFEMEGLKQWLPGRASGYAALDAALDRFGAADRFVRSVAARVS